MRLLRRLDPLPARAAYTATVLENQPMAPVKSHLGVPAAAVPCHTALIRGYVIKGHVPAQDIRRLAAEHAVDWPRRILTCLCQSWPARFTDCA